MPSDDVSEGATAWFSEFSDDAARDASSAMRLSVRGPQLQRCQSWCRARRAASVQFAVGGGAASPRCCAWGGSARTAHTAGWLGVAVLVATLMPTPPNRLSRDMEAISDKPAESGQSAASANLDHLLRVGRRRWWVILLCVVLTPLAAFALSKAQTPKYTATASLLFTDASVAQQASGIQAVSQSDPQGQRNTNLQLVQDANGAAAAAATELHDGLSTQQVRNAVTASLQGQSNIVSVSATSTSPHRAAAIANTFTTSFINQQRNSDQATVQNAIDLVEQQFTALTRPQRLTPQGQSLLDHLESLKILKAMQNNTSLVEPATAPKSPSSPKTLRNTILGAAFGLLIGLGLAFLIERVDRRLREPRDVEEAFGLPTLGIIPHTPSSGFGFRGAELEPYRMLRAHLRYFNVDRQLRSILVVSARPAEGKTTIARNLAATAADMGTRCLLIEADLRKPVISNLLGLQPSVGLTGALVLTNPVEDAVRRVQVESLAVPGEATRWLDVLPAGEVPPNPTELLESHATELLLAWAREHYDLVVIDTAPLGIVADAIPLIGRVDGVIVVSRVGVSTRDSAEHIRERLGNLRAPVLGIVINDLRERTHAYYGYNYGYAQRGRGQGSGSDRPSVLKRLAGRTDRRAPSAPQTGEPNEPSPRSPVLTPSDPGRQSATTNGGDTEKASRGLDE